MGRGRSGKGSGINAAQKTKISKLESSLANSPNFGSIKGEPRYEKDKNGNIDFEIITERRIPAQKSATIGVGDTPERLRTYSITGEIDPNGHIVLKKSKTISEEVVKRP